MGKPIITSKKKKTPRPAPKAGEIAVGTGLPRRPHDAPAHPVADQTNWRVKMQPGRIKFDDVAKARFLEAFAEHGRKKDAAEHAGVTLLTVTTHRKNDPDFAIGFDEAMATYRDKFVKLAIGKLAYEGTPIKKCNPATGEIYVERMDHATRLVELELKRIDPSYRDKQEVNLTGGGGVLVVPAGMTPSEWVADQERKNKDRMNPLLAEEAAKAEPAKADAPKEVVLLNRAEEVAARNAGKAVVR